MGVMMRVPQSGQNVLLGAVQGGKIPPDELAGGALTGCAVTAVKEDTADPTPEAALPAIDICAAAAAMVVGVGHIEPESLRPPADLFEALVSATRLVRIGRANGGGASVALGGGGGGNGAGGPEPTSIDAGIGGGPILGRFAEIGSATLEAAAG